MKINQKEINEVVKRIERIDVCGTGCVPTKDHHQIATEALNHLRATPEEIANLWDGWKDTIDNELPDYQQQVIAHICVVRAVDIVIRKHRWDYKYCIESISYTPILSELSKELSPRAFLSKTRAGVFEGKNMKIDFRKIIQKRLKQSKMSIPELARKVELNPQTLYNYLSGRSEMTSSNLESIIKILNIQLK